MNVTLQQAEQIVEAAKRAAISTNTPVTIAVVDTAGLTVALARMDDALLFSLDAAVGKAYTACALRMSTADLGTLAQPGQPLYGLPTSAHERPLVPFGGGLPLLSAGHVIGAIGVSGGSTPQDDQQVALAGQAALVIRENNGLRHH